MNQKLIYYFGYGANVDADMLEAIIGRRPEGKLAKLKSFELCVQHWHEIEEKVRNLLAKYWNESFRSYSIRPAESEEVQGIVWEITEQEHKRIGKWELHKLWYMPTKVFVESEGRIVEAMTEIINDKSLRTALEIHGESCPVFLNDKNKMLNTARKERGVLS